MDDVIDDVPLFQKCSLCDGTGALSHDAIVNTGGTTRVCPCGRSTTPGFSPVGLTLRQVMRFMESHQKLRTLKPSKVLSC